MDIPIQVTLKELFDMIKDEDVKIKMAVCPECKNAIMVSVVHTMDNESHKKFAKHLKEGYDIITISLLEFREKKVKMYCNENCKNKIN